MANIHQIITLGIGTPSDIAHVILFGLTPAGGDPTVAVFDTVALSESGHWLLTLLPALITDTSTVSESVANLLSQVTEATDTVTAAESVANVLSTILATNDSVFASEATTVQVAHLASVSSDVSLTENVANVLSVTNSVADTISITEAVTDAVEGFASIVDTVTLTDITVTSFVLMARAFDTVLLSEATFTGLSSSLTVIDTLTVTDAITEPLTWTIRAGGTVLAGVKVWLSSADPCTPSNLIRGSIQETDASGQVRYDLDFDRVYFGWRNHPQYTFPDPLRFRYSSSNSRWEQWNGSAYVEWTP